MPLTIADKPRRRAYEAAKSGRLGNWGLSGQSADAEIRMALRAVRSKSRHLAANNDYAKQFYRLLRVNVIGSTGIGLQVKARDDRGTLDKNANDLIEAGWRDWGKRGSCDVTGKLSWLDAQHLYIETLAKDGEVLVQLVDGFPNRFGFAIRFLEADHLDENLNRELPGGNVIRMGVEFDKWDRPVRYWLLAKHPGDTGAVSTFGNRYVPIAADQIIHDFITERARQSRGVPWSHTTARRLGMLDGFEEAALTAARVGASKMGFFTEKPGELGNGDGYEGEEEEDGSTIADIEPGVLEKLPYGWDFKEFNPGYPNGETEPFTKLQLRGISAGWGVPYHSLTSDLTDVNFSSIRQGELNSRDTWKYLQGFVSGGFCNRVFAGYLRNSMLQQAIALPLAKFDKFNAPIWHPRTWGWVDPVKDVTANLMALRSGLKTYSEALAEQGKDFHETIEQIATERAFAKQHGVDLEQLLTPGGKSNATANAKT